MWGFGSGFSQGYDPARPISGHTWVEFRSNMVAAFEEALIAGMGPMDYKIQYNFPVGNLTFENLDEARQAGNGRFLLFTNHDHMFCNRFAPWGPQLGINKIYSLIGSQPAAHQVTY